MHPESFNSSPLSQHTNTNTDAEMPPVRDPTFLAYSAAQAAAYAKSRMAYPRRLYDSILEYHGAGATAKLGTLLDVGCGPGNSTREFAPRFHKAVAIDGSAAMIEEARRLSTLPIRFECKTGEQCADVVDDESVDVLTSAMAAHWLDMDAFWPAAARVLKPGGTVAIWSVYAMKCHPSTPNAAQIEAVLEDLDSRVLLAYQQPGNKLVMNGYRDLELPWTIAKPVQAFDKSSFQRKEWDKDEDGDFFGGQRTSSLDEVAAALSTTSAVTRWREANAGSGAEDCVEAAVAKIRRLLGPQHDHITWGGPTTMLLLKKKQ